jgi:hypothetical protein
MVYHDDEGQFPRVDNCKCIKSSAQLWRRIQRAKSAFLGLDLTVLTPSMKNRWMIFP